MRYDPGRDLGWLLLRPWVAIPRLVQVLWSLAGLVLVLLLRGGSNDPAVQQGLARRILNTLTGLGPASSSWDRPSPPDLIWCVGTGWRN